MSEPPCPWCEQPLEPLRDPTGTLVAAEDRPGLARLCGTCHGIGVNTTTGEVRHPTPAEEQALRCDIASVITAQRSN